jgi:lipopolysaccharide/colanic/teichoic acid biosynthesis glycosyltransferase
MRKRFFDLFFSLLGLFFFLPIFLLIAIAIVLDSRGGVFFKQLRVGKNNTDFFIYKFRTMYSHSETKGLLTVGAKDNRVTRIGYYLRKFKLDELPQLLNVFLGTMSFVGPRPEVRKYVSLYTQEQLKVLQVRPGITDYASILYSNESELLANAENPEIFYIENVMPAKLNLNLKYIEEKSSLKDVRLILQTFQKIILSK